MILSTACVRIDACAPCRTSERRKLYLATECWLMPQALYLFQWPRSSSSSKHSKHSLRFENNGLCVIIAQDATHQVCQLSAPTPPGWLGITERRVLLRRALSGSRLALSSKSFFSFNSRVLVLFSSAPYKGFFLTLRLGAYVVYKKLAEDEMNCFIFRS